MILYFCLALFCHSFGFCLPYRSDKFLVGVHSRRRVLKFHLTVQHFWYSTTGKLTIHIVSRFIFRSLGPNKIIQYKCIWGSESWAERALGKNVIQQQSRGVVYWKLAPSFRTSISWLVGFYYSTGSKITLIHLEDLCVLRLLFLLNHSAFLGKL